MRLSRAAQNRKSPLATRLVGLIILLTMLVSAYLFSANSQQTIVFDNISGPILNPMMGWAPWATLRENKQPHTLVYADLTWRDFEPKKGVYDFESFETTRQIARWRAEGQRVVFRFVMDQPGNESHLDIPDWLFEKLNQDGEFYNNEYGKGFSPNYSNPVLLEHHRLAIKALGDQYGRDDFFAFIELGSLGHWGEWHTHPLLEPLPAEIIRNSYVLHYVEAFPDTYLLMRRPFSIARQLNLGLYNDMTGSLEDTNLWLDWIEHGGDYLPNEKNTFVPMPDGWERAPIGGEQAPTMSNEEIYATDLETTLRLLKEAHTTFIGPGGPYKVETGSSLQGGIDQVLSTIGYRLYIEKAEMPLIVRFGKDIQVKLSFSNDGIAPYYFNWPTLIYLFDESGRTIGTYPLAMDLRKILPGRINDVSFNLPVSTFENGIYSIGFAIIDPLTGKPGVKLANASARNDLIQVVGTFEVNWLFNLLKNSRLPSIDFMKSSLSPFFPK